MGIFFRIGQTHTVSRMTKPLLATVSFLSLFQSIANTHSPKHEAFGYLVGGVNFAVDANHDDQVCSPSISSTPVLEIDLQLVGQ